MSTDTLERPPAQTPDAVSDDGRGEILRGASALIAFFVIFLGWAAFAPLDAAVVAPGVVVVSGSRQTLQHRDGGTVTSIAVEESQQVRRGQILIELNSPSVIAQERSTFAEIVDLQAQRASLLAEIQHTPTIARPTEWATLSPEDAAIADQTLARYTADANGRRVRSPDDERIAGLEAQLASVNRQAALMEEELVGMRRLAADGMAPLTRVRALERAAADLEGQRGSLRAQIAATRESRAAALRDVEGRIGNLAPQLTALREQVERMRMRAPVDGRVVGLAVHTVGGVIGAGERVLDIVPEHEPLIVEARVRPEDADDLRIGLATEVRITAFRSRHLPIVRGAVQQISADRFEDQRTGAPYFRAQVMVSPTELRRLTASLPEGTQLRPGLPAEVVVPTRKRTALQYLLEPLNQALWGSFREN